MVIRSQGRPLGEGSRTRAGVLDKARGFIDKHRTGGVDAPTELVQLAHAQQQMAQALAELAEQNAALIVIVRRLQVRLRWLSIGLVFAFCAGVAMVVLSGK